MGLFFDRNTNKIKKIKDTECTGSFARATIKEEILKHYQEFLGSSPSTRTHTDYSLFDSKTLDDDDRLHLEADISEGETTDAMFIRLRSASDAAG